MDWGITTVKDVVETVAYTVQVIGGVALLLAVYTYFVTWKQLNFDVITSCTDRFQRILSRMKSEDPKEKEQAERQYVDLCNEQLFYFDNGYLPDEVVEEWMDGMINYLPQLNREGKAYPAPYSTEETLKPGLLTGYRRISRAFTVTEPYDLSNEEQRRCLIQKVRENLKAKPELIR